MAHRIPYCATASPAYLADFLRKVEKAKNTDGPSFLHILAPCPTGWGFASDQTLEIGRLTVQTGLCRGSSSQSRLIWADRNALNI